MQTSKIISILFLIIIFSLSVYSQSFIGGKVVDILDGRTIVIETGKDARINFRLQSIEVPEPEQQLYAVVKDHLRKLTIDKSVNIRSNGLSEGFIVGVATIGNIDISQQLLRDGAAWLEISNSSSEDYKIAEKSAKAEKRGVWGISGLKPAWEFRLEKLEKELAKQKAIEAEAILSEKLELANSAKKPNKTSSNNNNETLGYLESGQNFSLEYDSVTNKTFVSSQMEIFQFSDDSVAVDALLGFGYEFSGKMAQSNNDNFGVTIGSNVIGVEVLKENAIIIIAEDGKKISLGIPEIKSSVQKGKIIDVLFYKISRVQLEKLASGKSATFKLGKYQRTLGKSTLLVIDALLRQKT